MKLAAALLFLVVFSVEAAAQEVPRIYRLAVLAPGQRNVEDLRAFLLPDLAKRGFQEGKNLVVDIQVVADAEPAPPARDLIARGPDAILAIGGPATTLAMSATSTIPIVMFGADRQAPIGELARPHGNATGFLINVLPLEAKRLELLAEVAPKDGPLAVVYYRGNLMEPLIVERLEAVAERLGRRLIVHHIDDKRDFPALVAAVRQDGGRSLLVGAMPGLARDGRALTPIAAAAGLATACPWRYMTEDGCLLSYGPSLAGIYGRSSHYLSLLFRGTPVSQLPMEAPSAYETVINFKTAQTIGLAIPPAILARADDIIE